MRGSSVARARRVSAAPARARRARAACARPRGATHREVQRGQRRVGLRSQRSCQAGHPQRCDKRCQRRRQLVAHARRRVAAAAVRVQQRRRLQLLLELLLLLQWRVPLRRGRPHVAAQAPVAAQLRARGAATPR
jgi:hypothetical protein